MNKENVNTMPSLRPAKILLKRVDRRWFGSGTYTVFVNDTNPQALREETLE